MRLSIHDTFEIIDPFGKIMLSTDKYIDSFRAFTDLQKLIHGILVWELTTLRKSQCQWVCGLCCYEQKCMETKLNVKAKQTRIRTLKHHYGKTQSKAGRWYRMRGGNQEKVARSEAEHERRGVTRCRQALSDDQLCHTHTFATSVSQMRKAGSVR